MSARETIEQIKSLPPIERAAVAKFMVEQDDSWIPEEFKEAMKDAEAGRCVDMETALFETPPPLLDDMGMVLVAIDRPFPPPSRL
ncbi:MAG: hypothetical protein ABSA47_17190 [Verrucomicrobiota bacterium]|jgi:hypothetical protein